MKPYDTLLEISRYIATSPSTEALLPALLGYACKGTGASIARLLAADGESWQAPLAPLPESSRLDALVLGGNLPEGELVALAALEPTPSGKLAALIAYPVQSAGEVLGALWLGFDSDAGLTQEAQDFLSILSGQLALALATWREATARRVVDTLREAVIMVDNDMVIRLFNATAARLFKIAPQEAIGRPFDDIIPADTLRQQMKGTVDRALQATIQFDADTYQIKAFEVQEEGKVTGQLLVLTNVSHFKRLHENITIFLQTVSHDLRSPLTAAKGFVDMLSMVGTLNDQQNSMREKIITSIIDMTNLVEKVLDAGRLDPELGTYELRREQTDPVKLVDKVVSTLTPAAEKKHITLRREVAGNLPILFLDEMMIERALTNLVENAIKYSPESRAIVVGAAVRDNHLELTVADNGLGIPADKIPTLFDRGSRVRRVEHKAIRGSGLGLFIVKNVAQQHGGDASVDSVEGEGSTFRIKIPLVGANLVGGTGSLNAQTA